MNTSLVIKKMTKKSIYLLVCLIYTLVGIFSLRATDEIQGLFVDPIGGGGTTLHVGNTCGLKIREIIRAAKDYTGVGLKQIDISVYAFNDNSLIQELIQAAQSGVTIRIVVDSKQNADDLKRAIKAYNATAEAGKKIILKLLTGLGTYGNMHRKVIYVRYGDNEKVLSGSYNFTNAAAKMSYENCLFLSHTTPAGTVIAAVLPLIHRFQFETNKLIRGGTFPTEAGDYGQPPAPPPAPPAPDSGRGRGQPPDSRGDTSGRGGLPPAGRGRGAPSAPSTPATTRGAVEDIESFRDDGLRDEGTGMSLKVPQLSPQTQRRVPSEHSTPQRQTPLRETDVDSGVSRSLPELSPPRNPLSERLRMERARQERLEKLRALQRESGLTADEARELRMLERGAY